MLPHVSCLNVGTPNKPIYLPAEVCTIAPGQRRLKLDEKQTAEMIKTAAQKPEERAWNIERSINEKGMLPTDPHVRAFHMHVDNSMLGVSTLERTLWSVQQRTGPACLKAPTAAVQVEARILDPPTLLYEGNQTFKPGGEGKWDMRGLSFYRCAKLNSFAIASFMPPQRCGDPRDPGGLPVSCSSCQRRRFALMEVPFADQPGS